MEKVYSLSKYAEIKEKYWISIINYPLINAILSGLQQGLVYTSEKSNAILIFTKAGFAYFIIEQQSIDCYQEILNFITSNEEIPEYIHIYSPNKGFINYVNDKWGKCKLRERIQYRYCSKTFELNEYLPQGFYYKFIQDIPFVKFLSFDLSLNSRYWNSEHEFYERAIGACIFDNKDNIAAICYSACVVDNYAEMDTLVLPEYRGLGLMKIVSMPYFNKATEKKLITHWDTFVTNIPSYKIGLSFNPDCIREYNLFSIFLR